MRRHLATLIDDFRKMRSETAIVRMVGNRRRSTSYGELAEKAGRFAALLVERGIQKDERVLLWAENSAEWMETFYGCLLRGVVVVPLDALGSAEFAARVAKDVQPKLIVGDADLLAILPAELGMPTLTFDEWESVLPKEQAECINGLHAGSTLEILFTSGTTGEPKGVVLTHENVLSSIWPIEQGAQPYLRYLRLIHPLRILHTLPLSHVFGQTMGMWIPPILKAEVHFENRLIASRIVERIRRERISVLAAVPRIFALLKSHFEGNNPGLTEQINASAGIKAWQRWWRFRRVHRELGFKFWALVSGGGALTPAVEKFWSSLGLVVIQGYGMTESTALITLNHPFHVAHGTIGKPMAGRDVKLGPDGEVLVKGHMISGATWSEGKLHRREDEWLSTGDLAEQLPTGDLKFLGRKSEVIVTASGVNLHPEDLEAAFEEEPSVAGCAVVAIESATGPEACAVLALRGDAENAAKIIERANARLAEFQQLRYWRVWQEPDLPRTSTGKVKRKVVAEWLAHEAALEKTADEIPKAKTGDWLLNLIEEIAGEGVEGGDELRLTEDLHLDSLGRVQLAAELEERLGVEFDAAALDEAKTVCEVRKLFTESATHAMHVADGREEQGGAGAIPMGASAESSVARDEVRKLVESIRPIYPKWPWTLPVRWMRACFTEVVMQPLVWFLAAPKVTIEKFEMSEEPMLIVANHVTEFDGPLVEYALPWRMRRRIAAAISGEMLNDYRHFRNSEGDSPKPQFDLLGPLKYFLLIALFNVFPLPRGKDYQRSFAHAGEAMDRGFNVLVFPEGTRTRTGEMGRFRGGIGVLVKQSGAAVLPVALRGLAELKMRKSGWFRSGMLEVRVGRPMRFGAEESEGAITEQLENSVKELLENRD